MLFFVLLKRKDLKASLVKTKKVELIDQIIT